MMKSMARRVWDVACQELSAIIYGSFLRRRLRPSFDRPNWERVTAYLFHSNQFNVKKRIVYWTAFSPSVKNRTKSVYWISRLIEHFVWSIGQRHVASFRGDIKGRADVGTSSIYGIKGLSVVLTSKPHPRHADIVGWHADKPAWRLQAEKLADDAELVLAPSAIQVTRQDLENDDARSRVSSIVLTALFIAAVAAIAISL